jgi:glycosyltransferase involved in cell wall biosynthesis/GT2 family glycosyltransferase
VVVGTVGRGHLVAECVASIVADLAPGDELIVVDGDGSVDPATLPKPVTVLRTHPGKSHQLNAGIRASGGEIVVITDDDVRVPAGWIDGMAAAFTDAGVGVAFGPSTGLTAAPGGTAAPAFPPGPAPLEPWNFAHGLSMAVRRSAVIAVGGFDERLGPGAPTHGEEGDLVLRMRRAGWTSAIADAPPVTHLGWRDDAAEATNQLTYQRGAGAYLGAALRREPLLGAKLVALRLRFQAHLWRDRAARGRSFGLRSTAALVRGLGTGIRLAPRSFLTPAAERVSTRPRVLWVTYEPPDRSLGGGNIRQAHLVELLANTFDITLLTAAPLRDEAVRAAVTRLVEIELPPVATYRSRASQRWGSLLAAAVPRATSETWVNRGARRALRRALHTEAAEHDLIVINHPALYSLIDRDLSDAIWVAHTAHVTSERVRHELATTTGLRQRWLLDRDARKARAAERRAAASYDAFIVVSDADAALVGGGAHQHARGPVIIAPNGVDADRVQPSPIPAEPRIVLTGSLHYGPNTDGAIWFATEVFPLVRAVVPNAIFEIVGLHPPPAVRALAHREGVEVHGDVDSVLPHLARARVAVVPVRAGTGTRLKALEYLAAGRPVVGTSIGLEGLHIVDGTHALVRDTASSMAAAVVDLLESGESGRTLATAGRRLVEDRFRWTTIATALAGDLAQVLRRT